MAEDKDTHAEVHGDRLLDVSDSVAYNLIAELLRNKKVMMFQKVEPSD